jgi:hypothetical protein
MILRHQSTTFSKAVFKSIENIYENLPTTNWLNTEKFPEETLKISPQMKLNVQVLIFPQVIDQYL